MVGWEKRPRTKSQKPTIFKGQVRKVKPSAKTENESSKREEKAHRRSEQLHQYENTGCSTNN